MSLMSPVHALATPRPIQVAMVLILLLMESAVSVSPLATKVASVWESLFPLSCSAPITPERARKATSEMVFIDVEMFECRIPLDFRM
mgnify:CR=1 FL=1